jgi:outer membrane lipoprotein-sorting protein
MAVILIFFDRFADNIDPINMRKLILLSFFLSCGLWAFAQSADEIINKHIAAIGGKEKIKAVKSQKVSMSVEAMGMELKMDMWFKKPMQFKSETMVMGKKRVQIFNGKEGWTVVELAGNGQTKAMSEEELKQVKIQADFEGQLVDYKEKGHQITLVGEEKVKDVPVWNIKLTTKDKSVKNFFIDKKTHLIVKTKEMKVLPDGSETEAVVLMSDYKEVNGLLKPHKMEQKQQMMGQNITSMIKINKIEINPSINDSMFKKP